MKRFSELLFVLVLATRMGWPSVHSLTAAERKPNFVYVFTDDQRWDALGVVQREQGENGRFPWLKTPNLDRVAAEGIRFRNAFVVNSLCAPSRATLVTGQYGHVNGVVNNHTPHPDGNLSLPALLRPAGLAMFPPTWASGITMASQESARDLTTRRASWGRADTSTVRSK
jgi:hypothetical protein